MNWNRIWVGTALAGFMILVADIVVAHFRPGIQLSWHTVVPVLVYFGMPAFLNGFLLSWLYVLARPRLGPGPKTAVVMGSVGFGLMAGGPIAQMLLSPRVAWPLLLYVWAKCVAATYLAGWQYIEKAP